MRSRLHALTFATALAVIPGLAMSGSLAAEPQIRLSSLSTSAQSTSSPNPAPPALVDIPSFRSDPLGGSIDPGPGPGSEPVVAWHTPYGASNVWPLLVGGQIIGGSSDGSLVELDARTGEEQWRFAPSEGVTRSIGAADGSVFVDGPAHVLCTRPDDRFATLASRCTETGARCRRQRRGLCRNAWRCDGL